MTSAGLSMIFHFLVVLFAMDCHCKICHGVGEFWWWFHREQPPGTPEKVLIPCANCGGNGWVKDRQGETDSPDVAKEKE